MRAENTLSTVGTTDITLQELQFIDAGMVVMIAAGDSVATATLRATFDGVDVFQGPVPIESRTDGIDYQRDLATVFSTRKRGRLILTAGGTVAGLRVNILALTQREASLMGK